MKSILDVILKNMVLETQNFHNIYNIFIKRFKVK